MQQEVLDLVRVVVAIVVELVGLELVVQLLGHVDDEVTEMKNDYIEFLFFIIFFMLFMLS